MAHSHRAKAEAKIVFDVCHLLPAANEVCEGYVFTPVCQSFCSQGGRSAPVHAGMHTPRPEVDPHPHSLCSQKQAPPRTRGRHPTPPHNTRGRHPLGPEADPPPPQDQRQAPPLGQVHAGRYGQQAGGTHNTGMQSCSFNFFAFRLIFFAFVPTFA